MSTARALLLAAAVAAGALLWSEWPSHAAPVPFGSAKVRLYSGGEVIGEWEAVGPGRVEGDTFVFPVRKGVRDLDVRIRGTFTYEATP